MVSAGVTCADKTSECFESCGRKHILMITNHGVHEWDVVPGLPDTGGQNVYVNQFSEALVDMGYRVTIANRGGYPHPKTGKPQCGHVYHTSGYARIVYLEDGKAEFIRKEDMDAQIPELAKNLKHQVEENGDTFELIISHYWDACKLGMLVNNANRQHVPHIWIPHSLGALKKRNMEPSTWASLRIDERIACERELLASIDAAVSTSTAIRDTFKDDYGYDAKHFLPPCIDQQRYRPRTDEEIEPVWSYLAGLCDLSVDELRRKKFVTEISRTDNTKRKDVLINAFRRVKDEVPEAMLLVAIDPHAKALHDQLQDQVTELGLQHDVISLGSVWDMLPLVYCATDVYCTPSVMEGFGMSAQEAAASGKPIVSSNLVPFVVEYLVGSEPQRVEVESKDVLFGQAGVVVQADCVKGFANALVTLLKDDERRKQMGDKARDITVPYFTWAHLTEQLLEDLGVTV